jgi:glycosyltransferase involved in cell wall biosynthesis
VLLVVSSDRLAGTERHVAELARGLRQAGVDAHVACSPGPAGLAAVLGRLDVPVHPLGFSRRLLPRTTLNLARVARDFDVLHSHLTVATVAAAGAGLVARRPVVETRHFVALAYESRRGAARLTGDALRRLLQRKVAITVVPSSAVSKVTRGPTVVVAHGRDVPTEPIATPSGAGRFVTVGRLERDRNVALLIQAFAAARAALPPTASLTVVGDGSCRRQAEDLVDQLALSDQVTFTGWLDDPLSRLAGADVYLAAPFRPVPEAFGLAVLEAMGAGLPVIAEPGGGAEDLVVPDVTGLLVAPEPGLWAQGMVRLGTDGDLAAAMGAAGRRRAEHEFGFARMIQATIEVYRRVVGARPISERRSGARTPG